MKNALVFAAGGVVAVALAIPAIHYSRNPASWLGRVRAAVHLAPPKPGPEPLPPGQEVRDLARRFGPGKYSQFLEEWIIRDFFHDKRGGVFVDVGAADYRDASNTYFLEKNLGWSGIAVDAQDRYRAGWQQNRPNTRFFTAFVSDTSNAKARLFLSTESNWVASSQRNFTEQWGQISGAIDVQTITLDGLLDGAHVRSFDFLSLDIELAEPKALAGLDIERFHPALACVEAHPQVRQQILDYFAAHHYVVVGKYMPIDGLNIWFAPLGTHVEPFDVSTAKTPAE